MSNSDRLKITEVITVHNKGKVGKEVHTMKSVHEQLNKNGITCTYLTVRNYNGNMDNVPNSIKIISGICDILGTTPNELFGIK